MGPVHLVAGRLTERRKVVEQLPRLRMLPRQFALPWRKLLRMLPALQMLR